MTRGGRAWIWSFGALAFVAGVVTAMVILTGYARSAGGFLKRGLRAQGPPITAATLPKRLPGIPIKPGLVLDEAATNDPIVRLTVGLQSGLGRRATIVVFQTSDNLAPLASWYNSRMGGWTSRPIEPRRRGEHRSQVQGFSWRRGDTRLAILQLPQMRGRVVMVYSERPRTPATR